MKLNRWEKLRISCKAFVQEKIMDHIIEHIVGVSLLAGAMLLSGCWGFIASPAIDHSLMLREQEAELQKRIAKLNKIALKDDYAAYEQKLQLELANAEKAISQKPDLNELSRAVVQMAEQQLLQVAALHMPEKDSIKRHQQLPVEIYPLKLSLKGDYHNLVRFVRKAEENYCLRGIRIEGNKDGSIRAELELLVYGMV